ncbi:hypothetical protein HOLleu_15480 [Holothuria leucospilota]|uniref:Integrase catalytic domain-containing protein n=1 Tax=Holothuria leucospilota TaxID=206669 RepID=A0A9Q1C9T3_HOLLE|nr:hypothetical protein HOLleu_15480 [Holothuria leucospilota]
MTTPEENPWGKAMEGPDVGSMKSSGQTAMKEISQGCFSSISIASSSLRAQAAASAAAAAQNVMFEELIAKKTTEYKTMKALKELERAKEEAEAEAELKILRARQAAAVEKARSEAILECESEGRATFLTSPNESAYDHIEQEKLMDLTMKVSNTLALQRQPIIEPDIFTGDPLLFQPWKASFESMVSQAQNTADQKLSYLAKYTKGEVRQLVDRYRLRHITSPERAYGEVWLELERRFGNKSKVTAEIINRITNFPKLGKQDRHQLQVLTDLCVDAAAQMNYLPGLNILNYPQTLYPVLEKLPEHVHNTWRKEVSRYKVTYGNYPSFLQFSEFLRHMAKMYNDPDLYPADKSVSQRNSKATRAPLRVMATNKGISDSEELFCHFHEQSGHDTSDCIALGRKPIEKRRDLCRKLGLCFKCAKNHLARDCNTDVKCRKCNSDRHASFMHVGEKRDTDQDEQEGEQAEVPQPEEANIKCTKFATCATARSCSKIVMAKLYHENNPMNWIYGYVVLDDQSNACLGDPELFDKLDINGPDHEYELSTCGGHGVTVKGRRANGIVIESSSGHREKLPTIIENENIPGDRNEIPAPEICRTYPHLKCIAKRISAPRDDVNIILLLGRNCPELLKVRESRNGPRGLQWAQRTDLGWTVSGQVCIDSVRGATHVSVNRTTVEPYTNPLGSTCESHIYARDIQSCLHDDIYVERKEDERKAMSIEDERFIKIMSDGVYTNGQGNLEFPLPFKKGKETLPNNRTLATGRLANLVKTLRRKPTMMTEYRAFMEKTIRKGHATEIRSKDLNVPPGKVWYLPHFAVRHPRKPGIRVVFDASAEYDGIFLNKVLLQGPDQVNSLLGILLRFRVGEVAIMGDVEQMFYNFYVRPDDRTYLRFLWFKDNDPCKPVADYSMNVHLFGSVSSPAVATLGLRMVAESCKTTHGEDVTEFIKRNFYVDDGLTSVQDDKSAISLLQRSCKALATRNLRFHKIVSNRKSVLEALPEEDRAEDLRSVNFHREELPCQRSLGMHWHLETDTFTFKVNLPDKPISRRGVLSVASSIYDPIGLVSPVSIQGKLILRELMKEMEGEKKTPADIWDRPLPEKCRPKWNKWRDSLHHLENVHVPRCYTPPDFGPVSRQELHAFSDASDLAIGAVVYLRQISQLGVVHVSLVIAKARVTPKHAVSIPRLELCAAVLATTLVQTISPELEGRLEIDNITYYKDSKVVLGYISNESKRFHVYLANRVHKIRAVSDPNQWQYIPTDQNPADIASRSVPADQLTKTTWFRGPDFLWQAELQKAERVILKAVQEEGFSAEISKLRAAKANSEHTKPTIKKGSPLCRLNPFLDEDGIIKVGGRLGRSDLPFTRRHPILLPKNTHVSRLIVEHFHGKVLHQGRQMTLGAVRSGGFWIIASHCLVRRVIHDCCTCKRLRGIPLTQQMADLPEDRVGATPPFTNVGIDVFGPWTVLSRKTRANSSDAKRWAVIFTCLYSRAVPAEVIESLDTSSFIMALRRFLAIRGPVAKMRSYQGTNFKGAKGELETASLNFDHDHIRKFLSSQDCEWIFNPPHASHFGGVWERQIRTMRQVLSSMFLQLGKHHLTHEVLVTFMAEASAIVNSRPITYISTDANDPSPLSPSMLLTQKSLPLRPPPGEFVQQDLFGRKRWRQVQYLADQFWVRWKKEYLYNLQSRQKWLHPQPNINEGDVVILKQRHAVRFNWPLARVLKVHKSKDGKVRKVDIVVCAEGTKRHLTRPISELILIERTPSSD